jgi:hypothetical protein
MVPSQSRIPMTRVYGRTLALVVAVVTLASLLAIQVPGLALLKPVKKGLDWLRGYPAWHRRAALDREPQPFARLAASQISANDFPW